MRKVKTTGSSWAHAYDNLQAALAEADGVNRTQIWLAEGVYRPDAGPGRTAGTEPLPFNSRTGSKSSAGFRDMN